MSFARWRQRWSCGLPNRDRRQEKARKRWQKAAKQTPRKGPSRPRISRLAISPIDRAAARPIGDPSPRQRRWRNTTVPDDRRVKQNQQNRQRSDHDSRDQTLPRSPCRHIRPPYDGKIRGHDDDPWQRRLKGVSPDLWSNCQRLHGWRRMPNRTVDQTRASRNPPHSIISHFYIVTLSASCASVLSQIKDGLNVPYYEKLV